MFNNPCGHTEPRARDHRRGWSRAFAPGSQPLRARSRWPSVAISPRPAPRSALLAARGGARPSAALRPDPELAAPGEGRTSAGSSTASAAHPRLAIQGDTVSVHLAARTRARDRRRARRARGGAVPGAGDEPVHVHRHVHARARGTVPLAPRAFTIVDELGHVHHPRVRVARRRPCPARVLPGRTVDAGRRATSCRPATGGCAGRPQGTSHRLLGLRRRDRLGRPSPASRCVARCGPGSAATGSTTWSTRLHALCCWTIASLIVETPTDSINERIAAARARAACRAAASRSTRSRALRRQPLHDLAHRARREQPTAVVLESSRPGSACRWRRSSTAPHRRPQPVARRAEQPSARPRLGLRAPQRLAGRLSVARSRSSRSHFPAGARVAYETAPRERTVHQQVWVLEGSIESRPATTPPARPGDCLALVLDRPVVHPQPNAPARALRRRDRREPHQRSSELTARSGASRRRRRAQIDALADVLIDCVAGGASVSFMHPLPRGRAAAFWRRVAEDVAAGGARAARRRGRARASSAPCSSSSTAREPAAPRRPREDAGAPARARGAGLGAALMRPPSRRARRGQDAARARRRHRRRRRQRLYARLGWRRSA